MDHVLDRAPHRLVEVKFVQVGQHFLVRRQSPTWRSRHRSCHEVLVCARRLQRPWRRGIRRRAFAARLKHETPLTPQGTLTTRFDARSECCHHRCACIRRVAPRRRGAPPALSAGSRAATSLRCCCARPSVGISSRRAIVLLAWPVGQVAAVPIDPAVASLRSSSTPWHRKQNRPQVTRRLHRLGGPHLRRLLGADAALRNTQCTQIVPLARPRRSEDGCLASTQGHDRE